ncbi:hypothetical protein PQC13_gp108 [Synechococcus phage S-SRM01]|uniref:Uncharacterized protein n=1 Tax=Synechococcus phage S-SRM01 TaxID=2781608 RepID=A0A879R1K1_9CAUD|nr:hypothetical protein PQC13_gp108 [Synechococcus phage S-SRM01]QPX48073.1 hypothetical protein [Synechococcus phage S-SRM01]
MFGIEKDFQNLMEQVYGPLNKDKQLPDTIEFGGVKYKRVEDTQSFYDKLWGLLKTKLGDSVECDEMADRVRDLIREYIPSPTRNKFKSEYLLGYNEAIREVKLRLFNGIQ